MGDVVVIGSCSGNFYVLDRNSGAVRWRYDIHQDGKQTSFHGDPLVVDESQVLLGTDLSCAPDGIGHVYDFDVKAHVVRWKHIFPSGIGTPVVQSGGDLFFGDVRGGWYKAALASGTPEWTYQTGADAGQCGTPRAAVLVGNRAFVLGVDDGIYVIDAMSGKLVKRLQAPSRPETALIESQGKVLFGAADMSIYSLDAQTLAIDRFLQLEGKPTGRMKIYDSRLITFLKQANNRGAIAAIDLSKRKLDWITAADKEWSSDVPQIWNGWIIAGNCQGDVEAFSLTTGGRVWSEHVQGCIRSFGLSPDVLYVGAQQGMLYALRPPRTAQPSR